MTMDDDSMNDDWSAEVQGQLRSLPAERAPSREMKERTLEAARAAGYLRTRSKAPVSRTLALLAAASLIFVAGTLLGYTIATRGAPRPSTTGSSDHDGASVAQGLTINTEPKRHIIWY
jgi:hypothetical protein